MSVLTQVLASFVTRRRIGDFSAQVTIQETHQDDLTITDHPVEYGAAITDHAFKVPARLNLLVGWSNSGGASLLSLAQSAIAALASGDLQGADYVRTVYAKILALQATREPFTVITGKRIYRNMLISSLSTTTDPETENSLILAIGLREITIVQTQVVTIPAREVQEFPQQTAETVNAGTKQAVPAKNVNQTALKSIFEGIFGG